MKTESRPIIRSRARKFDISSGNKMRNRILSPCMIPLFVRFRPSRHRQRYRNCFLWLAYLVVDAMLDTEIRRDWILHIEPPTEGVVRKALYNIVLNQMSPRHISGILYEYPQFTMWLPLFLFTSLFNFVESNFLDWKFRGHSSLWSFFQYGFGSFVVEQMYLTWKDKWYLPMPVRGVLYVIWVYLWEFSWGVVLRHFNACPWDYSNRQWNVYGLITLQYFPVWYVASLYQELLSGYLLTLSKDPKDTDRKDSWCIRN